VATLVVTVKGVSHKLRGKHNARGKTAFELYCSCVGCTGALTDTVVRLAVFLGWKQRCQQVPPSN